MFLALFLGLSLYGQTVLPPVEPTPLQVVRVTNITSSATVIDNRSQYVAMVDSVGFCATGSGVWSAALEYADAGPGGPWTNPGSVSTVTSSSANCIGSYLGFHNYFRFLITGTASVNYVGTRQFYQGVLNGNGVGSQGPTGPPAPGKIPVSAYGVNGTSTDASNMQIGLNALAGIGCLYIPAGTTVNMVGNSISLPSHTCLVGDGDESIIESTASPSSGGVIQISAATDVTISGVHFMGSKTTATGIYYTDAQTNGPQWTTFTAGSAIFITGPSDQISIHDSTIEHPAGYAVYSDNTSGNITNVSIQKNTVKNSRSFLFGVASGQQVFGGWVGGILFQGPGTTYNYQNILLDGNTFQNVVGNAAWFHVGAISVLNSAVTMSNNTCIDTGLDCLQRGIVNGFTEINNKSIRNGYVVTSDVGATRVGGPMWLQGYTPVSFDNVGYAINGTIIGNVATTENGEGIDGDGLGLTEITGNKVTSCFASPDPLANASACGPYLNPSTPVCPGSGVCKGSGVGQNNFVRGMSINNSCASAGTSLCYTNVGWNLNISGNEFDGVGGGGIEAYGINASQITGNLISQPSLAYYPPIVLGNLGTNASPPTTTWQHSNGNTVSSNTLVWSPPSGSPGVFEDGVSACTCPFISTEQNTVRLNVVVGSNIFEFQKDVNDNSGTNNGWFSSVTAGAPVATGMSIQAEGILSSNLVGRFYLQYNGYGEGNVFTVAPWASYPPAMNLAAQTVSAGNAGAGAIWYCKDCVPGGNPCTSGGAGAFASSNGSTWSCDLAGSTSAPITTSGNISAGGSYWINGLEIITSTPSLGNLVNGIFSGTVTAAIFSGAGTGLTGTASGLSIGGVAATATALASIPTGCSSGQYATSIAASGNLGCGQVSLTTGVTGILPGANGGTGVTNTGTLATFPSGSWTAARTDTFQSFTGMQTFTGGASVTGGSGAFWAYDRNGLGSFSQFYKQVGVTGIYSSGAPGNLISLSDAGGVNFPNMPTSAGSGGLTVCVDSTGNLYKKSSCP